MIGGVSACPTIGGFAAFPASTGTADICALRPSIAAVFERPPAHRD
jgi:hypothetical protein